MGAALLKELEEQINLEDSKYKYLSVFNFKFHKKRYLLDLKIISKIFKKGKILDLGASPFHETFLLKKLGYDITGVDFNQDRYKTFVENNKLEIIKTDIEKDRLPIKDETFDLILMNEVIEHLTNPIHALLEANRILKKDGKIMLTTPNIYYFSRVIKYLMGKGALASAYGEFAKKYSVSTFGHIREYTNAEIKELLTNTNYKIIKKWYRKDTAPITPLRVIIRTITYMLPFLRPYQVFIAEKDDRHEECLQKLKNPPKLPKVD